MKKRLVFCPDCRWSRFDSKYGEFTHCTPPSLFKRREWHPLRRVVKIYDHKCGLAALVLLNKNCTCGHYVRKWWKVWRSR